MKRKISTTACLVMAATLFSCASLTYAGNCTQANWDEFNSRIEVPSGQCMHIDNASNTCQHFAMRDHRLITCQMLDKGFTGCGWHELCSL